MAEVGDDGLGIQEIISAADTNKDGTIDYEVINSKCWAINFSHSIYFLSSVHYHVLLVAAIWMGSKVFVSHTNPFLYLPIGVLCYDAEQRL